MRNADDLMWEQEFAKTFGQDQVNAIRDAALQHRNGIHDDDRGHPFRWSIAIAIGFDCLSKYAESHGIAVSYETVKQWFIDRKALDGYNGDVDFLSLFCGKYNEWVGRNEEAV